MIWISRTPRALAALSVLAVAACIPRGPKPAKLDTAKATALDLIAAGGATHYCPHGAPVQLKAVVTLEDGKRLETLTAGSRDGKLEVSAFEWSSTYGVVAQDATLRVPADPFAALGREVEVTATVVDRPDLTATTTLQPSFACGGVVALGGDPGRDGMRGRDGARGQVGSSGNSSTPATDGGDGGDGQDGGHGSNGGPGPDVTVALGYVDTEDHGRLALVRVGLAGGGRTVTYLVDPDGRAFNIIAAGGRGGHGGSGGAGGDGGPGGSNNIVDAGDGGDGGNGGHGAHGGRGGDGGPGGSITVYFDERHPELRSLLGLSTRGGSAGSGGAGGRAGYGGSGGGSASGTRGQNGTAGTAGQPGPHGREGPDGPPPQFVPAPAEELFADEIRRGLAIR